MIDVQYASLTSQGVQHRVFYLDGHPSRYQPCPTGLNFGEQTGTNVFPLEIAVQHFKIRCNFITATEYNTGHLMRNLSVDIRLYAGPLCPGTRK